MKFNLGNTWLKLGASVTTYFMATSAFAQAGGSSLGQVTTAISNNLENVPTLISLGSYTAGAGFGVSAVTNFKKYSENPNGQTTLGHCAGRALASAGCVALPWTIGSALSTMGGGAGGQLQSLRNGL